MDHLYYVNLDNPNNSPMNRLSFLLFFIMLHPFILHHGLYTLTPKWLKQEKWNFATLFLPTNTIKIKTKFYQGMWNFAILFLLKKKLLSKLSLTIWMKLGSNGPANYIQVFPAP